MSTRTSYRRKFAMATKKAQGTSMKRQTCPHASYKWLHSGHHSYKVCQACGEILKEETR